MYYVVLLKEKICVHIFGREILMTLLAVGTTAAAAAAAVAAADADA